MAVRGKHRPILIVDEPQSVDGGLKGKGKEALDAMNPLCTLRYSATTTTTHRSSSSKKRLPAYLKNMLTETKKSVFAEVVYDSGPEAAFADDLENNDAVKVYAKLPDWFKVPTPLGSYNPDWAVLVDTGGGERLYLVVEAKGTLVVEDLRGTEGGKIACGKAHFSVLGVGETPARYVVARSLDDVITATNEG